jgi:RHS repeat-associated protein
VKLAWTAAADAIGVTGYEIFQNTSLVATVSGVTQSYFVNGLTTGQTYTFTIQAGNATGAWSTNGPTTAVVAQVPVLSVAGAPPIDQTVASSVASIASFLYSGASPVQLGLKTTISNQRVAVLQGRVLDNQGVPLPGAAVTVADHPEYGYSISRADGHYDLVVNGGGAITISFDMSDTLHAERSEQLSWATFVHVPDVALVPEDAQATPVDLSGAAGIQVARGSQVQDSWGTRTATLVFAPGTTALMTLPSGASEALAGVHIRATEFTVGPNGPAAMPAALPATSGYTYAAAFTIDEAEAAQATGVSFSKPVAVYMEDFLNIFVGVDMPSGYYDSSLHAWVPSRNGRIVQVLSVSGGIATLDVDGQGQPASAAELATLGITSDELGQIAAFYPAGQDLWRVPIQHFSPWDFNQNDGPPGGACGPNQSGCGPGGPGGGGGGGGDCDGTATGCIIDIEAQILGEQVAVGGTPFSLNYRSERTSGYRGPYVLSIPLTDAVPPSPLQGVQLEVDIAGEVFTQAFNAAPSQVYTFEWDGNDGYGRPVQGQQPVSVKLGYVYTAQYVAPSDNPLLLNPSSYDADFGHFTYFGVPASTTGRQITLWYYWTGMLGDVHASPQDGLGGWTLSAHDMYDPASQTIFYGDGHKRTVDTLPQITTTIAGNPNAPPGFSGDGGPASQATLNTFQNGGSAVTVGPDGTVYILDSGNGRVRAITPDGNINTVATGVSGGSITTGPDGTLYIADGGGVRHIDSHGAISTVAGGGCAYPVQLANAVPALGACLGGVITSIAFAPDGTMYLLSEGSAAGSLSAPEALFRVTVDGYIWLVLSASGATQPAPSGVPLSQAYLVGPAELTFPPSMAVGNDGVVYISDGPFIRRIGNDGVFSTVAGDGFAYTPVGTGDGALATSVAVTPAALAVDPSGTVVFIDYSEYSTSTDFYAGPRVRAVHPDGVITTIAGTGASTLPGQPWLSGSRLAAGTPIDFPSALALAPDGTLLILQSIDALCRVTPAIQGDDVTGFEIANEAGTAVDVFDGSGRHLATRDALTASLLYSFTYDPAGRLASVIDLDGNTTTLQRDASGLPTAIVGPYGQSTALAVGADGSLSSIQDAVGNTYSYLYDAGGLLQSTTTPRGGLFQYIYDGYGRLLQDVDPAGGGSTFNLAGSTDGNVVTRTTAAGVVSSYHINNLASADVQQTVTQPNGLQSTLLRSHTGTNTQTTADGTVTTWTLGADPRFGMQAPTMSQMTIKTPSGLASATTVAKAVTLSNPTDLLSVQTATVTQSVNGNVWATVFNAPLKTLTTTSPAGRQVVTTIDTHGRPTQVALANTAPLTFTYDGHGRLLTTSQGTRTWSQSYDALGNLMSTTDPLGHVTSYANDHIGRPLTTVLPDGRQIGQTYDADSNVLSLTLPSDNTHAFAYTPVDLMSTYSPPTLGTGAWSTTYAYNLDRQVVTEMRPNGTTIASTYDPAGRLQTVTTPDGVATYVYDSSTGRLASSVASSGETLRYSYDGFLRTGVSWGGPITGTLSRGFDANFRMTSQTVNGVQLPFAYDPDGLVVQAGVDQLSLDPQNGRLRGTSLGAVMDSYSYDSNGLFGSYEAQVGVNALYSESVLRDVSGRITQKTETVQGTSHTWNYTYDANDRLTDATDDSGASSHYAYDGDDNRTTFVRNGVTINPTYDAQDRLLAYGAASYQYTANGELTNKTDGSGTTSYSYSAFGELLSVSRPDGTLIQYVHDAEHRRIGKNVNGSLEKAWLYDGQFRIVAELDNTGNVVSRFVPGDRPNGAEYMVRGGNTYRLIRDHIGSMRLVVDTNSGAIVERVDYDEFGVVTGDTQPGFQPFGFAGGLYDADTGLVRFGLRDYDASVGRWTAKDPTRFRGGMNLYGYVVNDPVDGLDFSGTDLADCTLASIWAASICVAALEDPFLLPLCIQAQADAAAECNNGGGATPQPNPSPCAKMCIGNGSSGCRVKKGEFKGTKTCNYGCDNGHNCSDKYVSCDKSGWSEPCPTSTESCE